MQMKFIHTSDIHLGASPDLGYLWNEKREKEIWNSFKQLIETVKQEDINLLLIAGDFFHRQPLARELKEVDYLFSTIPDTQVVIVAGNHDYIKASSQYRKFAWSSNVYGMWEEDWQEQYFPGIDTWIYGMSYHGREILERREVEVEHNGESGIHILMLHGGDESHIPFNKNELLESDFDYIALGHIHRAQVIAENRMAFCGALEPLDRNDIGAHGYIKGEADGQRVTTEFVPVAVRSYIPLTVEVTPEMSQFEIEIKISNMLEVAGQDNIFTLIITGFRDADISFSHRPLMELGNIVKVIDETRPDYDIEELSHHHHGSLVGAYIEHFKDKSTAIEKKALYYGINALLEAKREI